MMRAWSAGSLPSSLRTPTLPPGPTDANVQKRSTWPQAIRVVIGGPEPRG